MNLAIIVLFVFVALGLASQRLGKKPTYVAMTLAILAYVCYGYSAR